MIIYIKNPKGISKKKNAKKLLEVVWEFIKFIGYKVNICKSIVFLYSSNK